MAKRACAFLLLISLLLAPLQCFSSSIAVIYPKLNEPYSLFMKQIIDGIKKNSSATVVSYPIHNSENIEEVTSWFKRITDVKAIVALGNQARSLVEHIDINVPKYYSAAYIPPSDNINGISLFADPGDFITTLKKISPNTKQLFIFIHSKTPVLITKYIDKAAEKYGVRTSFIKVNNLEETIKAINSISNSFTKADAIWVFNSVLQINKSLLLPEFVRLAWNKKIVIFSEKAQYVNSGFLFSLFPDYKKLGERLSLMIRNKEKGVILLNEYLSAVNRRTAEHLFLNMSEMDYENFSVVFPLNTYETDN